MLKKIVISLAMFMFICSTAFANDSKVLVVAHDATWPPMEFLNSKKELVGYSVEYIDKVAEQAGFKVIHRNVAWAGIFAELAAGRSDVVAASVSITPERKNSMDFAIPYYEVKQAVVTLKSSPISKVADLTDKRIGTQIGTTGFFVARKFSGKNVKSYEAVGHAIEDLKNGRLDAVIADDPVAADFALHNPNNSAVAHIALVIDSVEPEFYGFAVKKGDKETLDLLNKGIRLVKEKGIEKELIKKWIGR